MKQIKIVVLLCLLLPTLLSARIFARWHTSMGSFTAELYDDIVPITANNFRDLANSGFYQNLIFHRVIDGFVIQDGCPNGTGTGGPGYTIPDEFSPLLNHNEAGILAMARTSAPNSAGSQYYFTLAPTPHLNGSYAVFGKVIEGLEYVLGIGSVPTDANDRPIIPVNIYQVRMLDLSIGELFPDVSETLLLQANQNQMFIVEAYTAEAELSYDWYIDEELHSESSFILETAFANSGDHTVRCHIASSDSIAFDALWNVQISSANADAAAPELISIKTSPNPFSQNLEISCSLKESAPIKLEVFNLKGQKVKTLYEGIQNPGTWNITWDGRDNTQRTCPAGLYVLKISEPRGQQYRKISKY